MRDHNTDPKSDDSYFRFGSTLTVITEKLFKLPGPQFLYL